MRFVETDIFAYEENPYQTFMVYIDYEKGLSNQTSELSSTISHIVSSQLQKNQL